MSEILCHCGKPLHYTNAENQEFVESICRKLGESVIVTIGGRSWSVQRHYLALHGLKAKELPALGFPEITHGETN